MPAQNIVGGTEQSQLVSVAVNGTTIGVFDSFDGGDALAPSAQHRSGGQGNMTSYKTLPKYSEATVGRVLNLAVDWETVRGLIPLAGQVRMTATLQPIDTDLVAYGNSRTASGMFLGISGIKTDSNSEALQNFMLHMSVDTWQ